MHSKKQTSKRKKITKTPMSKYQKAALIGLGLIGIGLITRHQYMKNKRNKDLQMLSMDELI